jgi:titin
VRAFNSAGSATSATTSTTTGAVTTTPSGTWNIPNSGTTVPSATSWVSATGGTNLVQLSWGDVANEQGYIVQRSTDGLNFGEVGRVGANVTSFTSNGLASSTKYYYRIQSYNAGGTNNSSVASATTAAAVIAAPYAPGWLSGAASGANSINIVWGDVANEQGYIIERSTDGWNFSQVTRVAAGVTSSRTPA